MRAAQRSMNYLRRLSPQGLEFVGRVEQWVPGANIRRDLFNLFDLVWLSLSTDGQYGQIVGIQVVNTHLEEHLTKIASNPAAQAWLACGGGIEVHNWKKRGPRGKRKKWLVERIDVGALMLGQGIQN